MSFNIVDLQRFYDLRTSMSQMMDSLPSLIDSVQRQDELTSNVAILEQRVQDSLAISTQKSVDAQTIIDSINAQIEASKALAITETTKSNQDIADSKLVAANTIAELESQVEVARQHLADIAVEVTSADEDLSKKLSDIDAKCADLLASKMAEVDAMEAKRVAIELAVKEFRTKFS